MLNCPTCEFADFDNDKCKRLLTRLPHVCPYAVERKPRNHFEEIKAISMEDLASILGNRGICPGLRKPEYECRGDSCEECWLEYLKEEIKND